MRELNKARRAFERPYRTKERAGMIVVLAVSGLALACCCLQACADAACDGPGDVSCAYVAAELRLYDAPSASRLIGTPAPVQAFSAALPGAPPSASLTPAQRRVLDLAPRILAVARNYDIDPLLLHAIAEVESRHDPQARSRAGALGVLQVLPVTARRFGVTGPDSDLLDADVNLAAGAAYLKALQARYGNDLVLVLAAYNAGEGAVERHGRSVPPYAETRRYVQRVLAEYRTLCVALDASASAEGR